MKRQWLVRIAFLIVAAGTLTSAGCITRSKFKGIAIAGEGTVEEKVQRAQALVTAERLERLKNELRDRLPDITADQLTSVNLRWQVTEFHPFTGEARPTTVHVIVSIREDAAPDVDRILDAALAVLRPDVNPQVPSIAPGV